MMHDGGVGVSIRWASHESGALCRRRKIISLRSARNSRSRRARASSVQADRVLARGGRESASPAAVTFDPFQVLSCSYHTHLPILGRKNDAVIIPITKSLPFPESERRPETFTYIKSASECPLLHAQSTILVYSCTVILFRVSRGIYV